MQMSFVALVASRLHNIVSASSCNVIVAAKLVMFAAILQQGVAVAMPEYV
jgi:hypothetical protein